MGLEIFFGIVAYLERILRRTKQRGSQRLLRERMLLRAWASWDSWLKALGAQTFTEYVCNSFLSSGTKGNKSTVPTQHWGASMPTSKSDLQKKTCFSISVTKERELGRGKILLTSTASLAWQ